MSARRLAGLVALGAALAMPAGPVAYTIGHALACASEDSPMCVRVDFDAIGPGDHPSLTINGPARDPAPHAITFSINWR